MQDPAMLAQLKGAAGTAITGAAASVTWIERANEIVDLMAGIVAIVAGLCTVAFYIYKARQMRKEKNK